MKIVGGGIYKITNTITGKVYIGSCKDFDKRLKSHRILLKKFQHQNRPLQRDALMYGLLNFTFRPIKFLSNLNRTNLLKWEIKFIEKYDAFNLGYNINPVVLPIQTKPINPKWVERGNNISLVKQTNRVNYGKTYKVVNPMGEIITIKNIALFCNTNQLYIPAFRRMAKGGRNYRGYKFYQPCV